MTELLIVFILAFVVEAVWQALKPLWPGKVKEAEASHGVPIDAIGCAGHCAALKFWYRY